ncbi:hypothetical protein Tco_0328444 [Tanacetum coccineum]|uniref:Uncharacterized protein n=1 Tax=Tanacetum coccineum TaxID=301880 RepID=A0ABQ4WCZ6_9ASTR
METLSYDKHGVPPTKRLFRVAMLDHHLNYWTFGNVGDRDYQLWFTSPPVVDWSDQRVLKACPKKIVNQELKREDSDSADVKTRFLNFGVVKFSLFFSFIDQRSSHKQSSRELIKFIQ